MRQAMTAIAGLASALAVSAVFAQGASGLALNIATAQKMVAACIAFAEAHKGAVNIWVFDSAGGLVHFQRMDGAPRMDAPLAGGIGSAENPIGLPNPTGPGSVPVNLNGRPAGTVRAEGMGPFSDRACAQAAAAAASARDQRPQP